jgi:hypothetical protein
MTHFYVRRDTNAGELYPRPTDGSTVKFDDLVAFLQTLTDGCIDQE